MAENYIKRRNEKKHKKEVVKEGEGGGNEGTEMEITWRGRRK